MGRGKVLTEDEKAVIIKESAKGTSPYAIAAKIGRHVDTVKIFWKIQERNVQMLEYLRK